MDQIGHTIYTKRKVISSQFDDLNDLAVVSDVSKLVSKNERRTSSTSIIHYLRIAKVSNCLNVFFLLLEEKKFWST